MRIGRDEWALRLAAVTALRGTCLRRRVGCVLTDARGRVLATGYNGVARGRTHCNEYVPSSGGYLNACPGADRASGVDLDLCEAVHAEVNALLQCADVDDIDTCYVTVSPCVPCLKMLMNTGCRRIVSAAAYVGSNKDLWTREPGRTWSVVDVEL